MQKTPRYSLGFKYCGMSQRTKKQFYIFFTYSIFKMYFVLIFHIINCVSLIADRLLCVCLHTELMDGWMGGWMHMVPPSPQ